MDDRRHDDRSGEDESVGGRSWEEFLRRTGEREDASDGDSDETIAGGEGGEGPVEDGGDRPVDDGPSEPRPSSPKGPPPSRVVVPPEADEFEGASRRRRRLVVGGIAALAVLVGGYLVYRAIPVRGGAGSGPPEVGSAPEAPPPSAAVTDTPAADVPASVDEEREPTPPRSEPEATSRAGSERSSLFRARATTVDEALSRLRERLRDYRLGRIGCEGLARGLREMRAAFDRLEEVAGPDGEALRSADRGRYRSLVNDAGAAEGAFSGTGCSPSS